MDLLTDIAEALTAAGADPALVAAVMDQTRRTWGGESVYLRKRDAQRQASAVRELVGRGLSLRAVARELGVADGTVRRVVAGS